MTKIPLSDHSSHTQPLIPLDSAEALWEWHITTDLFFLSQGACRDLGLAAHEIPGSMAAFLAQIPPAFLPTLYELRETVLSGHSPFLEASYPFKDKTVWERMLVLTRSEQGRASRVIGHYQVTAAQIASRPARVRMQEAPSANRTGYWQCSLRKRIVHVDGVCAALLGFSATPRSYTLEAWKDRVHPEDRVGTECQHTLVFESPLMGDTIEDILRIRLESGEYARVRLQGAVLARNESGRALTITGTIQQQMDALGNIRELSEGAENGRLLSAINAAGDGLWDWDSQTDSVYYSPRYLSMIGYSAEEFPGDLETWKQKIHPDDIHKIVPPQRDLVESSRFGDTFECTYRLLRKDGTWAWILGRGYVTHRDANGKATRLVGLHTDITATQSEREQLEDLVKNDALTRLRSRTYCDVELQRIERNQIRPVSIISCDVNGLKMVNDHMGHAVGDKLLRKIALALRNSLRATDCVARMGGDEFVIVLPGCPLEHAQRILTSTRTHLADLNAQNDDIPVYVAFGLATTESSEDPVSRILIEADRIMLREKELTRKDSHRMIKAWIERHTDAVVSLEDCRYEM